MTSPPTTVPRGGLRMQTELLRRFLESECLAIVAIAGLLATLALAVPKMIVGDTWLALVDGRWVAEHGLPKTDALAAWTAGTSWVDQQWFAQLALYHVAHIGGMRLTLALAFALDAAAIVVAAIGARRAGATVRSVAIAVPVALIVAPWALQARTQSFALPLFVAVYALLAADSRRPSRRVFLVLPLLAVWGNLHGSAVLGAGLAVALGLLRARSQPRRSAALAGGAVASLLVSPYGSDLIGYYHTLLIGSPLRQYVDEWRPTSFGLITTAFFVVAFSSVYLVARHARAVSTL